MSVSFEIITAIMLMMLMMTILWAFHVYKGEADIVDAGWAAGLGFLAIFYAISLPGDDFRKFALALFAGTWSARLTTFLIRTRVMEPGEDGRYQSLRRKWGHKAKFNFFLFFQAQGLLVVILAIPFFIAASNLTPGFQIWDYVGAFVFVVSIAGESIADKQLSDFRKDSNNKGKTCRQGLWKYSRHPNYFFEWLHWWSYVFLSINSPVFLLSLIGPCIMLFLILKVSGIPPTEKQALESRGDDYREYQKTTNAFFPWFPKESHK